MKRTERLEFVTCAHCGMDVGVILTGTYGTIRVREPHPINGTIATVERNVEFCSPECLGAYRKNQESNHA